MLNLWLFNEMGVVLDGGDPRAAKCKRAELSFELFKFSSLEKWLAQARIKVQPYKMWA